MLAYEIERLSKTYRKGRVCANDDLSFTVETGEFFGLLGDNGAGKTTLVRQMCNLLSPDSGTIRLFNQPINITPLYAATNIGYMPQSGGALNNATVNEALYFTAHLRGLSRHDARAERDRLLEILDIGELSDRPVPRLSGGQKRLVLLATALAASPPVMILDEPTNDLDPQYRARVWEILRTANIEHGVTIILVTHNVLEAEKVIQRVAIMKRGKIIALGRPGALKAGLNQQLRVEIVFAQDTLPPLPNGVKPDIIAPGRWQFFIDRADAPAYLDTLNQTPTIEDFRLGTATLEDLYLSTVT